MEQRLGERDAPVAAHGWGGRQVGQLPPAGSPLSAYGAVRLRARNNNPILCVRRTCVSWAMHHFRLKSKIKK